jgi:predicted membrane metal-binding protein
MIPIKKHFHYFKTPPIILFALSLIAGILMPISPWVIMFFLGIIAIHMLLYHKSVWHTILYILCYSIIALIGACLYQKKVNDYATFYQFTHKSPVTITGTIIDKSDIKNRKEHYTVITLMASTIQKNQEIKNCNKKIIFYCHNNTEQCIVGDIITVYDIRCTEPLEPSVRMYQIKENIAATLFCHTMRYSVINHPHWSFDRYLFNQRNRLIDACKTKMSDNSFLFFTSLFLGNRSYNKEKMEYMNESFKRWGVYHLLSRSGMHLAFFIYMWQYLLSYIPIHIRIKQLLILIISFIYHMLSWPSIPFIRSLLLGIIQKTCFFTNTAYHSLHYLTALCFFFLLYNPLYLFFLDFQLSFSLTFSLIWLNQLYSQCLHEDSINK